MTDAEMQRLAVMIGKEVYRAHEKIVLTMLLNAIYAGAFWLAVFWLVRLVRWIMK